MELTLDQALQKGIEAHRSGQIQEADRYYTAILKAKPKHPDANHNMGVLAVAIGKVNEALPFFKTALEVNPGIAQFWLSYIDALIKMDQIDDAKALFQQAKNEGLKGDGFDRLETKFGSPKDTNAVSKDSIEKPPQDQLQPIINLYTNGQYEEVINEAKHLLLKFPNSVFVYNIVGAANHSLGQLDKAIEAYNKAISFQPDYAEAYINLGAALKKQNKLDNAIEAYNKAIAIKPNYAEAYNNIGNALKDKAQLDDAIEAYNKAIAIKPNYAEAYNNIGNALLDLGKLEEAIEAYNKAIAIKPNYAEVYNNLGIIFQSQLKLFSAIEAYNRAIAINPNYAAAHNNLGNALKDKGQLDNAIEAYSKAISINPNYAEVYNNMGYSLREQGQATEAIEAYKKAISLKPHYTESYNNMGVALQDLGKLEGAIEAYEKAISIEPNYAEAWFNGADALEKWNELGRLELWIKKAIKSLERLPADINFFQAKLLWRNKKRNKAHKLMNLIKLEEISEVRKQDYLGLKAKCFEELEKFKEAYDCFVESNLLAKKSNDYAKCNSETYFQSLKDNLIKIKSEPSPAINVNPAKEINFNPVFLVGFPRSGTTLLDTILRSHSKIEVVEEQPIVETTKNFLKGLGYDGIYTKPLSSELLIQSRNIYQAEFEKYIPKINSRSVYVDKLPLNLFEASLIQQLYPNAKFILALRHPMDTILSCWMQNFKLNAAMANMVDLDRIVEFYCIAMETFKIFRSKHNLNVHEIKYEDLVKDLRKETSKLLEFLNLRWEPQMENYHDTAIKRGRINTPSYSQVVQPIYKDAQHRWLSYRKYLHKYLDQVKPWINQFKYQEAKALFQQAKNEGLKGDGFDRLETKFGSPKDTNAVSKDSIEKPPQDQLQPIINLYTNGQYEEVINEAKHLLLKFPNSVFVYNIVGAANHSLGQLDKAIEAYNKAISFQPDYAEAYINLGAALKKQNKLDNAIEAYNKAIAIKPNYAEAYNNIGNALKDKAQLDDAIEAYNKAIAIKPNYAEAYNNIGNALLDLGKLEEAIEAYNKAIAIKPNYAEVYYNMGTALKEQGNYKEAIEAYNKAIAIKPNYAETFYNLGVVSQDLNKLEEAMEAYRKALAIKPDFAEAYNNLGVIFQDQGKLEEAIEAYNKAISIKPDYAKAHRHLSRIKEYTPDDPQFLEVKSLLNKQDINDDARSKLNFALAKMYEDMDLLDLAFTHLSEGNALRKRVLKYSIDQDKKLFEQLKKTQPLLFKNSLKRQKTPTELTPIFILGMPRSGTTLVEQIISSHSKVTGAGELKYLSQYGAALAVGTKTLSEINVSEFRKHYLAAISKEANNIPFITDKMPHNFRFIPLICAALPEAKIIHVKRDPAATCWSNYKQYFATKSLGYCYNIDDVLTYFGLYSDLMQFWQNSYNNEIYNLDYENLTTDQENETKKLIQHLNLKWENACLAPHKNKRSVRTASQQQVTQKLYQGSSNAWKKYEKFLDGAFHSLSPQ